MLTYEFYNQMSMESFPFVSSPVVLGSQRPELIVNAGVIIGPKASFSSSESIKLYKIEKLGLTQHIITLKSTGVNPLTFVFTFTDSTPEHTTIWTTDVNGADYGIAFITLGSIANIIALAVAEYPDVALYREQIQTLKQQRVTTFNVANKFSTLYEDLDCGIDYSLSGEFEIVATGLTGIIDFKPGRHILVSTALDTNELIFGTTELLSSTGDVPCESPRPLPEGYSENLEPSCAELVYTLNGVGVQANSNIFILTGTNGVIITNKDANTILITLSPSVIFGPITSENYCESGQYSYYDIDGKVLHVPGSPGDIIDGGGP